MEPNERRDSSTALKTVVKTAGAIAAGSAAAGLGWLAYSALGVNHQVPLAPAISADRRRFDSSRAGSLNYYVDRSGGGTPLVLLHSVNACASAYEVRPLFERFRKQRAVYALDLPGFGFSDRQDLEYTPELYAQSIVEWLNGVLGEEHADVVALSLTSEFAARAAIQQPDVFRSLSMISPTGFSAAASEGPSERAGEMGGSDLAYQVLRFPLWSRAFYDLLTTPPSIRYFLQKSFVGPVPQHLIDYDYATAHQPGARFAPLRFISGYLFTPRAQEQLYDKVKVPVMVYYDRDGYVSFEELKPFIATHSYWHAERIEGTFGLPQFEQLDRLTHSLDDFWEHAAPSVAAAERQIASTESSPS